MRQPMNQVKAPWTADQVASLNAFQADGRMHDFTCNRSYCDSRTLIATASGWYCSGIACSYQQDWAYDWMCNWDWKRMLDAIHGELHDR